MGEGRAGGMGREGLDRRKIHSRTHDGPHWNRALEGAGWAVNRDPPPTPVPVPRSPRPAGRYEGGGGGGRPGWCRALPGPQRQPAGRHLDFFCPPAPSQGLQLRGGAGPSLALSAATICDPRAPPPPFRRNVPQRLGCREPENHGPRPWQPRQHIYLLCSPISAPSGQVFALVGPREDVVFVSITGARARRPRGHSCASIPCQHPAGTGIEWTCQPRLGLPAESLSSGVCEMGIGKEKRTEADGYCNKALRTGPGHRFTVTASEWLLLLLSSFYGRGNGGMEHLCHMPVRSHSPSSCVGGAGSMLRQLSVLCPRS